MQLKGKVALITGAASGIGKDIAKKFAKEGALAIIADQNVSEADQVAKEIIAANGHATSVHMDVTQEESVESAIAQVLSAYHYIDILVSNAGVQYISSIDQLSFTNWRKIIAIHLDGAFLTTRACLRSMYQSGRGGSIIYMGSVHSKEASPLKAPYVAAKHGLLGLCKVVAKEGAAHHVRANVICPGYVKTPLVEKQIPEQAKKFGISEQEVIQKIMLKDTVDGEFTTTADVAEIALFFASFASNALTGQSLIVSHGWSMQ